MFGLKKLTQGVTLSKIWKSHGATNGGLVGGVIGWGKAQAFAQDLTTFLVWLFTGSGRLADMPPEVALAFKGWLGAGIEGLVFLVMMLGGTLIGGYLSVRNGNAIEAAEPQADEKKPE